MKRLFMHIVYGAISIALFSILFFLLQLSVIFSAAAGLLLFFVLSGFLGSENSDRVIEEKTSSNIVVDALENGFEKLNAISEKTGDIEDPDVRSKVGKIYDLGHKILAEIRETPSDFNAARQFFSYYLDATNTILDKYVHLQKNKEFLSIADESFQKTENLLDTIETAYQKQLEKLYEDDVMDLDNELKVLAKTLKMEGF